jgi:CRISPR type I-E-associated protein CasB/Cse2
MTQQKPEPNSLVDILAKVVEDRGKRAALRRYWSPATKHVAYPALGQLHALTDERRAIVACLYAEHPEHRAGVGVGKAARLLGQAKDGEHPYEKHFRRLLACRELEDLKPQLHRLVKRLSREGVGLDYTKLHENLNYWTKSSDRAEVVKLRWAADFWQAPILNNLETAVLS